MQQSPRESMQNWFTNDGENNWEPNIFDVIANSINIMEYHITQSKLMEDQPDILLQPELGHLNLADFDEARITIDEGYNVAKSRLDKLMQLSSSAS
jgi:NTE family protein